jgi:pimeloyl-ACP methyl ester carboxylesterase
MKKLLVQLYGLYLNLLGTVSPKLAGEKGFLLFCRPFRLQISEKQQQFFNSAEKFMIDHEGQQVQGYRWGNGEKKILFLHGWQSHTYRWKAYIEALPKDQYTILAVDAPAHGLSPGKFLSVPLYSSLIETVIRDHGPIHTVAAHSLGGFTLLYTFYRFPLLPVNNIILMATPGEADDFISVFQTTLKINERTLGLIIDYFKKTYDVKPEFFSTIKFAPSINVNGLIIHDEDDPEAPYHYSTTLNKVWKRSRLVTTRGLGHNLKSTSIVKEVIDFIEEPVSQPALT